MNVLGSIAQFERDRQREGIELDKQTQQYKITAQLLKKDLVIFEELGYLHFSQKGVALLFHLISQLYEHVSIVITTNLAFSEWATLFADEKIGSFITARLLKRETTLIDSKTDLKGVHF